MVILNKVFRSCLYNMQTFLLCKKIKVMLSHMSVSKGEPYKVEVKEPPQGAPPPTQTTKKTHPVNKVSIWWCRVYLRSPFLLEFSSCVNVSMVTSFPYGEILGVHCRMVEVKLQRVDYLPLLCRREYFVS